MAPPFKVSNEGLAILERVYQESSVWPIPDDIRTALVNQVGQIHTYIDNWFCNRRKKDKGVTWGKETAPPKEQQAPIPPPLPLAQLVYDPIMHQPEQEYPMFEENYEQGGANNEQGVTMDDPFYHAEGGANNEQDVTIDDLFFYHAEVQKLEEMVTIAREELANESKIGMSDASAGATTSGKPIAGTFVTMGIGGECSQVQVHYLKKSASQISAKVGRHGKTIARGERANESKIGKSDASAGATTSGKPIAGTFATMGIGGECS
nr:hypothetical protein [Tanacetum cinerariifolium]